VFRRLTTKDDRIEIFGIFELILPIGSSAPDKVESRMVIENQSLLGFVHNGSVHFRFSPKAAKAYSYAIRSSSTALDGQVGELTAVQIPPEAAERPDRNLPNWWTDHPAPEFAEGPHAGAKTVNRWRKDFLADFATRMNRVRKTDASAPPP
jgi:hypothetical protein